MGTDYVLRTVDRALRLLLLLGEEAGPGRRVGELAAELGVDKSTASRLVATLADRGFLERAPGGEAYRLGPELGRLGALAAGGRADLVGLARDPMERLAEETGETVNLAVIEEGGAVVNVAQADGPHLVGVGNWVGRKTAPHATANGKVLLAFARGATGGPNPEGRLEAFTARTIASAGDLRSELARVRRGGWATTVGELEEGFNGVAVPVFDASGRCAAALSVSGPVYRVSPERLRALAALCSEAAGEIEVRLGRARVAPPA